MVVVLILFFCFAEPLYAADEALYGSFSEEFSALMDGLPKEVQVQYSDVLNTPEGAAQIGDLLNFTSIKEKILSAVESAWPSAASLLIRLFALILCAGVFRCFKETFHEPALGGAFSLCVTLVFALSLAESVETLLTNTLSYLEALSSLSAAAAPIAAAVTAATGHLSAAAVSHASLMLLFTLIQNVGTAFLLPLVRVSYCLGIVSSVGKFVRVESITKCVRKTFAILLSFLTIMIGFVVGAQSILSKSADSFSLKTVKFAVGNMIPMVGSAVSDALSTVTGSLSLIRSAAGGLCVLSLLILLLPVLTQLLLHRIALVICQGAAEMLGCEQEGKIFGELHGIVGCLLAVVSLMSILFLFVVTLFTLLGGSFG